MAFRILKIIKKRYMTSGKKILFYSTLSVLLLYFSFLGLASLKGFFAPFTVAVILSLLVLPLSRGMENQGMNRGIASMINTILIFIVSLGFFALLSIQAKYLFDDWPKIKTTMQPKVDELRFFIIEHSPLEEQNLDFTSPSGPVPLFSPNFNASRRAANLFTAVMNFFWDYLLTFIYIFFILTYRRHFKKFLLRLFPDDDRNDIQSIITRSANVIQQYLLGKLILIGFLAVFYSIGLGISGVSNFILVSILAAFFSVIPYLGNIIGLGMAMVFGYLTSGELGILVGIFLTFFIGQFIESYILNPYVVGDKVDLHPFIVILVVIVGNLVWGIVGMILSIPILAVVNIILLNVKALRPFGFLLSKEGKVKD